MRQREKINYSHCRQFSTFRAGKYNYTQFTTAREYLMSKNVTKDINDFIQNWSGQDNIKESYTFFLNEGMWR